MSPQPDWQPVSFYRSVSGTQPTALSVTHAFTEQALLNEESVALYYVFDMGEQGFVIVSADDNLLPVIGYSKERVFPKESLPPHVAKWFEQYKAEIRYVLENGITATRRDTGKMGGSPFRRNSKYRCTAGSQSAADDQMESGTLLQFLLPRRSGHRLCGHSHGADHEILELSAAGYRIPLL
jgi:hypothetical protein